MRLMYKSYTQLNVPGKGVCVGTPSCCKIKMFVANQ
jgi:hypothetical protein